jgi:predicted RNA binding protein YcfA (HicA-like mRNA interferase family)
MSRLPLVSSERLVRALRRAGFADAPLRGKGSHRALFRVDEKGRTRLAIIPRAKTLPRGTLNAILKQAGMSPEELRRLLK